LQQRAAREGKMRFGESVDRRGRGHTRHEALRALAHKWLKIILAMRRTATPYSEDTYVASRRRRLSKTV